MNIYLSDTSDFDNNGLGFLTDCLSASVVEEINGVYNLNIEYLLNGHLSEYLERENIIKCEVADGTKQLFRIKHIEKDFNKIKVTANHIFYDLLDNFLLDASPTNLAAQAFGQWILSKTNFVQPYTFTSAIATTKSARYVRKNPVEAIMGDEYNSMINLFSGEVLRNNFNITLKTRLGEDRGLTLLVAKNITGVNITIDDSELYTRVLPLGYDALMLPEVYVDSPLINTYPTPKIRKYEFSDIKYDPGSEEEGVYTDIQDAYQALRDATNELYANGLDKPQINVSIDWIELSKTEEYKNYQDLETIRLGDTLRANLLGLEYITRVIAINYNPLGHRVDSFTIGEVKPNITNALNQVEKLAQEVNVTTILDEARTNATNLINNALTGYIYLDYETGNLYIMDTDDPSTAQRVWRWNLNGLGYSDSGINGTYDLAMTMDGSIVADFISTGTLNTSVIEGYDSLTISVTNQGEAIEQYGDRLEEIGSDINTLTDDIDDINTNGVSKLSNTLVTIDSQGINVSTNLSKISTIMSNDTFAIKDNANNYLAYFGYDELEGKSKAEMDNLTIHNYFVAGYHRTEKFDINSEQRTGWFYVGGGI